MATNDSLLVDADSLREALYVLADCADPDCIPALDPAHLPGTIVLRPDGSVLDGNHRIVGIAKWMERVGMDLDKDFVEIPAILLSHDELGTYPI